MKWTFHPESEDLTTTLPLSVEISDFEGSPRAHLEGVGELDLKKVAGDKYRADFYVSLPGNYKLTVSDARYSSQRELVIAEHQYLDFTNEFGAFFLLFLCVMGGVILWTRKIMKQKTA